jgi:hypothetical protein
MQGENKKDGDFWLELKDGHLAEIRHLSVNAWSDADRAMGGGKSTKIAQEVEEKLLKIYLRTLAALNYLQTKNRK